MGNPTLRLDGDASGAVKATSDVASAAQNLKRQFDDAAQSAKGINSEFESGSNATSMFNSGMVSLLGNFAALAGPGAVLSLAISGMDEYIARLQKASDLSKDAGLAGLAQLGSQQLGTARGLIAAGTPEDRAASITQALEGASASDAAFIRAAAPTNVFNNLGAVESSAKSLEAQYGGDLPSLLGKFRAGFSGTGFTAEQGLEQFGSLAPAFQDAGIGQDAAIALSGEMSRLYNGEGTGKLQMLLQGGIKSGFFENAPADVKNDPGRLLSYLRSQGMDAETLSESFPGRGAAVAAQALSREGSDVSSRFSGIQGASGDDAYGILGIAKGDTGIATQIADRAQVGSQRTSEERLGNLQQLERTALDESYVNATKGSSALSAAPAAVGNYLMKFIASHWLNEEGLTKDLGIQLDGGTLTNPSTRDAVAKALGRIEQHTANTARNTRNSPGPSGVQE